MPVYQEKALVGAFSVIVKTGCGTDGALHSTSFTTASPGISCRDGTCLHNVGGQYRVEISGKYSTLLWFTAMTITVCGRHPTESVTGVQQSAAAVLLSLLDLYWVILSYTEDWMSAACCCYGLAILLPQLEHQFLFFIGASDRVFRKLFHFKIVRNLLNIYHGIMCYCCFFAQILSHGGSWWNIHWNIFE